MVRQRFYLGHHTPIPNMPGGIRSSLRYIDAELAPPASTGWDEAPIKQIAPQFARLLEQDIPSEVYPTDRSGR